MNPTDPGSALPQKTGETRAQYKPDVWVLRIPLVDGARFHGHDHKRIVACLNAVLEHMIGAGVDSRGGVMAPHGSDYAATWRIERAVS